MTHPKVLAMARECAAKALSDRGSLSSANEVRHGRDDTHAAVQAAIAAIERVTELAADYIEAEGSRSEKWSPASSALSGLITLDHLPEPEGGRGE